MVTLLVALTAASVARAMTGLPAPLMEALNGERPIQLQSLRIASDISGSMAQTTVKMVFFNPNTRPLEGNLQFPLLAGQQITAFALDIDGQLRPAVPMEKAKGRQIFEEIERRHADPALLEQTQGNNFKLRVYPIAANGVRTVELKYAESLNREGKNWAYRLPLAYADQLQNFDLTVKVHGSQGAPTVTGALGQVKFERSANGYVAHVEKSRFASTGVLDVRLPTSSQTSTYVQERDGATYFVAELAVPTVQSPRVLPKVLGLLWDSSGSASGRDLAREIEELNHYFKALGNVQVRLTRLRDRAEEAQSFEVANGNWDALRKALQATEYDGASALGEWKVQPDVDEYLLVSDGLINYGRAKFPELAVVKRLYALSSALQADTTRLAALAERSGGRLVQVDPAKPGAAAQALLNEGSHVSDITAVGATDVLTDAADVQKGVFRIAGKLSSAKAQVNLMLVENGKSRVVPLAVSVDAPAHPLAAHLWASYKLRSLEADFEMHRAEIRRLGMQFRIPTRETSLIVLDTVEDYVRYDLVPPASLDAAVEAMKALRGKVLAQKRQKHLEDTVREFEEKIQWWEKTYPKTDVPRPVAAKPQEAPTASSSPSFFSRLFGGMGAIELPRAPAREPEIRSAPVAAASPPPPTPVPVTTITRLHPESMDAARANSERQRATTNAAPAEIGISVKKWTSTAPYVSRLKAATPATAYKVYLDEKPSYANSSGFYLDAADILAEKGARDLALRVLSNLVEMDLENRHILRILGYRLLQLGEPALAVQVFEKVVLLAQEEPQSYRDLGLALAASGHHQQAIDQLNEVLLRAWDGRFAEIELIVLAEMNAIIATAPGPLDTSHIDRRLLRNLPLDLRAVLTWDADNSDMDLHVIDPNGERCYYKHRFTYQGARLSRDFTGGYGPEEFSLRDAKPGKYRIEANFYGTNQQALAGPVTLQVKLSTGFGTSANKDQMITLRLKGQGQTEFVGEFEVKPKM
ncbi:MAG: DUF2135 domain-containing protein [Rhodoferax sp.]|nr:DUF2135 domain-containing protein [Rhodoferax sp.]